MTTETQSTPGAGAPAKRHKLVTPLHIIELLIIVGLLLLYFGFFKNTPRVAIITSGEGPYWDLVELGAKRAAEVGEIDVDVIRCKTDVQAQTDAIRAALAAKKYDGIAISPINPLAEAIVLSEVAGATTLVTLDSDAPVAGRLCFVGTDNYEAGERCAQLVREALPNGGELIVFIGNPEKQNTQRRRQGLIDELLDRPFEPLRPADPMEQPIKGEKYTIAATLVDGGDPAVAAELAAKAVKEHPATTCFVGLLGFTGPALLKGIEQSGSKDAAAKVKVIGFDASPETLAAIESGQIFGTIVQDQFGCGYHAVRILGEKARGSRGELGMFDRQVLPCSAVTKENVAETRKRLSDAPQGG